MKPLAKIILLPLLYIVGGIFLGLLWLVYKLSPPKGFDVSRIDFKNCSFDPALMQGAKSSEWPEVIKYE